MNALELLLIPSFLALGCGLQLAGGVGNVGHGRVDGVGHAGLTTFAQRRSGPAVGLRANMVRRDHGLSLRSGTLHAGWDARLIPGWFALEPGLDFGAGQPSARVFSGVGAYAGGAMTARLRVVAGDREPVYNLFFPVVELVVVPRAGVWMPPEGSPRTTPYGEGGIELGFRFGIGSDIIGAAQGHFSNEGTRKPATPESPAEGQ
jgi:hypothetical protein